MAKLIIVISLMTSLNSIALKEFHSDYCSLSANGNWKECCYDHDLFYWLGGTKKHQKSLDKELRSCIKRKAGPIIANIYYIGVRLGHYSPIKLKTRWSWGWEYKRKNTAFSKSDIQEIINQLEAQGFPHKTIQHIVGKLPKRL